MKRKETVHREIPQNLQIRIFFHTGIGVLGVVFMLFGSIFPVALGSQADVMSIVQFRQSDPIVVGTLTDVSATSYSEQDDDLYAYRYRYVVNAVPYTGESFARWLALEPQTAVPVKYVPGNPGRSRIDGMRAAPFSWYMAPLTALLPLTGLVMIAIALGKSRRFVHLLRCGVLTAGTVTQRKATRLRVNDTTVYRVAFCFTAADGQQYETWATAGRYWLLRVGEQAPMVYDPANPGDAMPLVAMPREAEEFMLSSSKAT